MADQSALKAPLHQRAAEEFKVLLALTPYLYVCLGALLLLKTAILRGEGIDYTAWGTAAVKAARARG